MFAGAKVVATAALAALLTVAAESATVSIDPSTEYQTIAGFGGYGGLRCMLSH